jgi:nitrite reductase (cytochrome c-552)
VELIGDIRLARSGGAGAAVITNAQASQRRAQFLLDFIEAENSMGFHAPQESMRILGLSINHTRLGQRALKTQ